ncbi:hypothetical protein KQI36_10375 [Clostridium senegalense]|uniref:hypothetical protein n=1 Tax=Clostridium senegalense TaxID=1465809 RepID=UPI001C123EAD|nr:hypothetical protein [Clostridium senegalense]MBU5227044.1 hypothetical protein [Clostridium senegalense]
MLEALEIFNINQDIENVIFNMLVSCDVEISDYAYDEDISDELFKEEITDINFIIASSNKNAKQIYKEIKKYNVSAFILVGNNA